MKTGTIEKEKKIVEDVSGIMKSCFPYYDSDDKDDYIYLVKGHHVNSAAFRIMKYIRELGVK